MVNKSNSLPIQLNESMHRIIACQSCAGPTSLLKKDKGSGVETEKRIEGGFSDVLTGHFEKLFFGVQKMNSLADKVGSLRAAATGLSAPVGTGSKRIIDVALALSGIVLLAPLLLICYVLTIASSPGPALFRHRRVGFNGKHFDCLKFRTMATDAPERLRRLLESDSA